MRRFFRPRRVALLFALIAAVAGYFRFVHFHRGPAPGLTGKIAHGSLRVGDRERTFAYYAPSPLPVHAPLLLAFHGSSETGDSFRWHTGYGFDQVADTDGFVVVYPDGFERHWNDCRKEASYSARTLNIDDIGFVRALIAHFQSTLGIDPTRVFATGHSNGGQMAYRLGLEMAGEIRGIAAISASLPTPENSMCKEGGKPVPALIMNGTDDPLNPYDGGRVTLFGFGNRGLVRSSLETALYFAKLDGAPSTPSVERLPSRDSTVWVEEAKWGSPGRVADVELDTIHGGGHVVPQGRSFYPRILGRTDSDFDGPAEIGRFFSQLR